MLCIDIHIQIGKGREGEGGGGGSMLECLQTNWSAMYVHRPPKCVVTCKHPLLLHMFLLDCTYPVPKLHLVFGTHA